jgi:uncharacterized oligopeptide transporter (OPT) family protein
VLFLGVCVCVLLRALAVALGACVLMYIFVRSPAQCDTGFQFWNGLASVGFYAGSAVLYFGCNLSPALLSVGYIIQLKSACLLLLGGILNWYVAIPLVSGLLEPTPYPDDMKAVEAASYVWSNYTRYIGVGAMVGAPPPELVR